MADECAVQVRLRSPPLTLLSTIAEAIKKDYPGGFEHVPPARNIGPRHGFHGRWSACAGGAGGGEQADAERSGKPQRHSSGEKPSLADQAQTLRRRPMRRGMSFTASPAQWSGETGPGCASTCMNHPPPIAMQVSAPRNP